MPATAVSTFERFFREAAGLDVHKNDIKRFDDFIDRALLDLLIVGVEHASADGRDTVEPHDLPTTRGLRERIREFERMDVARELEPVLERIAEWPPLDLALGAETEARIPHIAGGIGVGLARAFTILDPGGRTVSTRDWGRAIRLFDQLL